MSHDGKRDGASQHVVWTTARIPLELFDTQSHGQIRDRIQNKLSELGIEFVDMGSSQLAPDPFAKGGLPDGAY